MTIEFDVPVPLEPDDSGTYDYRKCPFYGSLSVRDQALGGTVVLADMTKTVVVGREYSVLVPRYNRYVKRRSRTPTHVPDVLDDVAVSDKVTIAET